MSSLAQQGLLDRLTRVMLLGRKPDLASKATIKLFGKHSGASCPLELIPSNTCEPMNMKA